MSCSITPVEGRRPDDYKATGPKGGSGLQGRKAAVTCSTDSADQENSDNTQQTYMRQRVLKGASLGHRTATAYKGAFEEGGGLVAAAGRFSLFLTLNAAAYEKQA